MNLMLQSPLTFAQQELPPDIGSAPTTTPATPSGGTAAPNGAPGGTSPAPGGGNLMFLFIIIILAMLIFTMWSSKRDRKRREAMISAIKKHDRVQTIGGVIGSVVEVKPDYIVLKVDESSNTRITFARSAVQQVFSSSQETTTREESP